MTILVTGATGTVGTQLVAQLARRGANCSSASNHPLRCRSSDAIWSGRMF